MKKRTVFILVSFIAFFSYFLPIYASEGGESDPLMDFLFQVINFAALFGLLFYFAKKPVRKGLTDSAAETKSNLDKARKNKKQAEEELEMFREKLANMKQEAEQMIIDAKKEAGLEKERIIKEGEAIAEKLKEQVRVSIEQEYNKATLELRKWAAEETVKLAEEKIKKEMNQGHQNTLFENYLNKLN